MIGVQIFLLLLQNKFLLNYEDDWFCVYKIDIFNTETNI